MESLYNKIELKQPKFFQRLLKNEPQENAFAELNNLLSSKQLKEITFVDVEKISNKYKVDFYKKYTNQLKELFLIYLKHCLKDNVLADDELNELSHLKSLLGLKDKDVDELQNQLCSEIYEKSFTEAIIDGKLEENEVDFLRKLQASLKLPDDIAEKISIESRKYFVNNHLKEIISDQRLSPNEELELEAISKNLNVKLDIDENTKSHLEKLKLYWFIENATLPVIEANLLLQKNELCHFSINADWLENRTVTKRINYSGPSLRLKIARGLYYRAGSIKVQRITSEEIQLIDHGVVYLTNKRIIFIGNKKNINIKLDKILSVTPYSDGVQIEKETGKSPIVRVNENGELLNMILSRLLNE